MKSLTYTLCIIPHPPPFFKSNRNRRPGRGPGRNRRFRFKNFLTSAERLATITMLVQRACGSGTGVVHRLAKARVASSNLVFRSKVKPSPSGGGFVLSVLSGLSGPAVRDIGSRSVGAQSNFQRFSPVTSSSRKRSTVPSITRMNISHVPLTTALTRWPPKTVPSAFPAEQWMWV